MVLQVAVRDIGQLTDFEPWPNEPELRAGHYRDVAEMRHDPAMAPEQGGTLAAPSAEPLAAEV